MINNILEFIFEFIYKFIRTKIYKVLDTDFWTQIYSWLVACLIAQI